jgi:hypothetical protein
MTIRERVGATWAEWRPSIERGSIGFGPLILMTRAELGRIAREHRDVGRVAERRDPGGPLLSDLFPAEPKVAEVRQLRSI